MGGGVLLLDTGCCTRVSAWEAENLARPGWGQPLPPQLALPVPMAWAVSRPRWSLCFPKSLVFTPRGKGGPRE